MLNLFATNPLYFLIFLIALLVAITVHEFAHAWMTDYLGDPTPRLAGRLTLNPLAHLDLFGLIFLFFFGFGWGKPSPFDPFNLKNPKKDAALISLAGPSANIILAIVFAILLKLFIVFKLTFFITIGSILFTPLIGLNVMLGIFNLLPIHPLDGFKIVGGVLPTEKAKEWYELERYGLIFLLLLVIPLGNSSMLDMVIRPIVNFILSLLLSSSILGSGVI